jgi:hypothetical protein
MSRTLRARIQQYLGVTCTAALFAATPIPHIALPSFSLGIVTQHKSPHIIQVEPTTVQLQLELDHARAHIAELYRTIATLQQQLQNPTPATTAAINEPPARPAFLRPLPPLPNATEIFVAPRPVAALISEAANQDKERTVPPRAPAPPAGQLALIPPATAPTEPEPISIVTLSAIGQFNGKTAGDKVEPYGTINVVRTDKLGRKVFETTTATVIIARKD